VLIVLFSEYSLICALLILILSSIISGLFSKPLIPALLIKISILLYKLLISLNILETCFESDTSKSKDFPFKFLATLCASEDKTSQMIISHPSS